MFEQSLVDSGGSRNKSKYAFAGSIFGQTALIGLAVLVPLIYSSPLPSGNWMSRIVVPWGPPPQKGSPIVKIQRGAARPKFDQSKLMQPTRIPRTIDAIQEEPESAPVLSDVVGVEGGILGGMQYGLRGLLPPKPQAVAAPPRVEPPKAPAAQIVNVHRSIQQAKLAYGPLPVYPPLARQQRVSGLVRLNAIIGTDGAVQQLKAVSGHPLLVPAALEAVSRWRYRPTLLNGEPVEVITQIDVNFTLTQ